MPSKSVGSDGTFLAGVAAPSPGDVWAVGEFIRPNGEHAPLTQRWDGEAWTNVPTPDGLVGGLSGVDATSSTDVWAVGTVLNDAGDPGLGGDAIAMHWDGVEWGLVDVPKPEPGPFVSTSFRDVVAIGPDDVWAVGFWSDVPDAPSSPLVAHWDGDAWEVVPSPDIGEGDFYGVGASGPNDVWAVGSRTVQVGPLTLVDRGLFERWSGDAWEVVPTPRLGRTHTPFRLESVDARSTSDAWAVGQKTTRNATKTISYHWDGDGWTRRRTVNPSDEFQVMGAVAMGPGGGAWAVGFTFDPAQGRDETLLQRWNGERWVRKASGNRKAGNSLFDVALVPGGGAIAVGSHWANGGDGPERTLVLRRCPA